MNFNYIAPNPYPSPSPNSSPSMVSSFFSFFSSGTWLESSSSSIEETIGTMVLPAQMRAEDDNFQRDLNNSVAKSGASIQFGVIHTHDGAEIDTMEMRSAFYDYTLPNRCRRFVIKFNGNGGTYADGIANYLSDANGLGATIVAFNYRNVGHSKKIPHGFQDLVTDGIAQVNRLLELGAHPNHILLDGHSLGGAVATMVADYFHQKKLRVYLWNDRSFATLSKAAAGLIAPRLFECLDSSIERSVEWSSSSVMSPSGWDVNISMAYLRIPAAYRAHMVIQPVQNESNDEVIPYQDSLDFGVSQTGFSINAHRVVANNLRAHNLSRYELSCTKTGIIAQRLFEDFAQKLNTNTPRYASASIEVTPHHVPS